MSIATALSGLRKRERAIRTGLLAKGYDVGYPQKYDNDTSAIISVLGGINGRNAVRNGAIKAMAEGPEGADSVILDDGVLDLRGFYNTAQTIRDSAFANSTGQKIVFPYMGRSLSAQLSAFIKSDNLTAVTDSFIPGFGDFDPADPMAIYNQLRYARKAGTAGLGTRAFASCMNLLESPSFNTISTITFGPYAFYHCSALTSLGDNAYNAPNNDSYSYLFSYTGLTGINYTDFAGGNYSVRMFGTQAFANCDNLVSVYMRYPNFGSGTFRNCDKLSVIQIHSNDNPYSAKSLMYTGSNMIAGCPNLLCVDCSHFGPSKNGVTNVYAPYLTAGNTAKWVFGRSMEPQLTGTWLSNATLHSRLVFVDDPKELRIKYDDGTVFEYSFEQLSSTHLSGNQGITANNWLSAVRDELLAHGPLSNIVEISASQFFNGVSPNFLNCGSSSTKLSSVYFPCILRYGTAVLTVLESGRHMLQGQRNIKDLLSAFPNLVYCDGMELYGHYFSDDAINIGGVALPNAKYVHGFLGNAVAEYYDLPKARLVGRIHDSDHLKYVYAPKIEALVLGNTDTWITKLSGVSLSDINMLYTAYGEDLDMDKIMRNTHIHPAALSNVEHMADYDYDYMYAPGMVIQTDVAFPKLKIFNNLEFPNRPISGDVLSGVNLNSLQWLNTINMRYLSVDCDVELPSLQFIYAEIQANSKSITAYTEARRTPYLINLKLPNLLSARGIVPALEIGGNPFETKYTDSQVSIVFDFSGKTAQSADGKVHPPVLTFTTSLYTGNGRYRNALSTFSNMYKSVKFIFDRELSAEVLEDTPNNHWRYNANGVKWPDSLISCYQFV